MSKTLAFIFLSVAIIAGFVACDAFKSSSPPKISFIEVGKVYDIRPSSFTQYLIKVVKIESDGWFLAELNEASPDIGIPKGELVWINTSQLLLLREKK